MPGEDSAARERDGLLPPALTFRLGLYLGYVNGRRRKRGRRGNGISRNLLRLRPPPHEVGTRPPRSGSRASASTIGAPSHCLSLSSTVHPAAFASGTSMSGWPSGGQ